MRSVGERKMNFGENGQDQRLDRFMRPKILCNERVEGKARKVIESLI